MIVQEIARKDRDRVSKLVLHAKGAVGAFPGRFETGMPMKVMQEFAALFAQGDEIIPDRAEDAGRLGGYQSHAAAGNRKLGVPATRIHVFDTYEQAARAVRDGRVDAYASVARAHQGYLRQNTGLGLAVVNVPAREKPPALGCFAFPLAATEFKERVDRVLSQFIGSARHQRLVGSFGFDAHDVNRLLKAYP